MRLKKILAGCALMAAALSASAGSVTTVDFEGCDKTVGYSFNMSCASPLTFVGSDSVKAVTYSNTWGNFTPRVGSSGIALLFGTFDDQDTPDASQMPGTLTIFLNGSFNKFSMWFTTFGSNPAEISFIYADAVETIGLTSPGQDGCLLDACNWVQVHNDPSKGAIKSIEITAPQLTYFFDDFQLSSSLDTGNNDVPEPAGATLTLAALGALALTRRRRQ